MGIEDVANEEALKVGNVDSNISPESVSMDGGWWQTMAVHYPSMLYFNSSSLSESEIKKFIHYLDNVIQKQVTGHSINQSEIEDAQHARERLIEELEKR